MSSSCLEPKCLVGVRGQRRVGRVVGDDQKARPTIQSAGLCSMSQSSAHLQHNESTVLHRSPQSPHLSPVEHLRAAWEILRNCVMLSCHYGAKSLRKLPNILLNLCREKMKAALRVKNPTQFEHSEASEAASGCSFLCIIPPINGTKLQNIGTKLTKLHKIINKSKHQF